MNLAKRSAALPEVGVAILVCNDEIVIVFVILQELKLSRKSRLLVMFP